MTSCTRPALRPVLLRSKFSLAMGACPPLDFRAFVLRSFVWTFCTHSTRGFTNFARIALSDSHSVDDGGANAANPCAPGQARRGRYGGLRPEGQGGGWAEPAPCTSRKQGHHDAHYALFAHQRAELITLQHSPHRIESQTMNLVASHRARRPRGARSAAASSAYVDRCSELPCPRAVTTRSIHRLLQPEGNARQPCGGDTHRRRKRST